MTMNLLIKSFKLPGFIAKILANCIVTFYYFIFNFNS